jgi:hypothetical protein
MRFLNPIGFFLLGLIPVLLLIHSLKPKPKTVEVTALFLWKGALKEMGGGSRIRNLTKNLPLLFQILIILLAALVLAEPVWTKSVKIKGDAILVLDNTASMQTGTKQGTRLEMAKKEAFKIIEELSAAGRMLIIEAARQPKILVPFSRDRKHLRRAIEGLQPLHVAGDLEGAVYLALSFLEPKTEGRIFLLTDNALTRLSPLLQKHKKVHPILFTEGGNNIGITHFECRPDPESRDIFQALLEIKNFNPHPVVCPIRVISGGERLFQETVGLPGREKKRIIFPFSRPVSEIVRVSLEVKDDLPLDNQAYSIVPFAAESSILLISRGNHYLDTLLRAYPHFKVHSLKEILPASWEKEIEDQDLIILDGITPPSTRQGNFLLINTLSPSLPLIKTGFLKNPVILDWDRTHPVMRNLDLGMVRIRSAFSLKTGSEGRTLLQAKEGGLIYAFEMEGRRTLLFNFDLRQSDLPMRVAFPVLMTNAFQWLQPHRFSGHPRQIQAGNPFPLHFKPTTTNVSIGFPGGRWVRQPLSALPFSFEHTGRVGIYTVLEGQKKHYFAVNLFDESESDIGVDVSSMRSTNPMPEGEMETSRIPLPLWYFLLPAVVIFLVLEFHIWLRRG